MRINSNNYFGENLFIDLKDESWLLNARIAGKIAAKALFKLEQEVKNKTTKTLLELNDLTEKFIIDSGGYPTFKGYKGFPSGVCISVNNELVHGIPKNYILKDGDIVSFDLGVTVNGSIVDTAITCIYGLSTNKKHIDLVNTTNNALIQSIKCLSKQSRIGCIGNKIYSTITSNGFNVIEKYGGHGISISENGEGIPHSSPFVSNKGELDEGVRIQSGLVLAIEPMAIIGDTSTYVSEDGWTVIGNDLSAHFEHTIYVSEDTIEVLTWRPNCGIDINLNLMRV